MKRKTKTGKLKILGTKKLPRAHLLAATGFTDAEIRKRLTCTPGALKQAKARPSFEARVQETRAILELYGAHRRAKVSDNPKSDLDVWEKLGQEDPELQFESDSEKYLERANALLKAKPFRESTPAGLPTGFASPGRLRR